MKFKKVLKLFSNVLNAALFLSLVLMTFVVISAKASGGEPQVVGYQIKNVLSGSMEPEIQTGSIIAVKPLEEVEKSSLIKGDVITFKNKDESLVTHRIIEVQQVGTSTTYQTKGDNNNAPDTEPVLAQNVVGKYADFTIPYAGYLMNYAGSRAGSIALMILPGILLLMYSGYLIWNAIKQFEKNLIRKNSSTKIVETPYISEDSK